MVTVDGTGYHSCTHVLIEVFWEQMSFEPWIKYPALTQERLLAIAGIFQKARRDVVALYEPSKGDEPWCLGCRAYSWIRHAIQANKGKLEWLDVVPDPEKALRFTFSIGSIPLRFYRGDPNDPPSKSLTVCHAELRQQRLALDFGTQVENILRIAIETDERGLVSRVTLVELDEIGTVLNDYEIPLNEESVTPVVPLQAPGIELPAPPLRPRKDAEEEWKERNAG